MRKVTRQIIQAWARGDSLTLGNTSTNGEAIWLHGNPIAWKTGDDDVIALTLCGWNTVTTRERLNGILHLKGAGYRFAQRDWKPVLLFKDLVIEIYEHETIYFNITQEPCGKSTVSRIVDYRDVKERQTSRA
jgi:hypothetical protein